MTSEARFPYRVDSRFKPLLLPFGVRPGQGVTVTEDTLLVTFGWFRLETPRENVAGGHVTEHYHWYKAIGARLSAADDGLTFGTNADRGVCIHFRQRIPRVLGFRPHSALTVTVADCEGLIEAIGAVPDSA